MPEAKIRSIAERGACLVASANRSLRLRPAQNSRSNSSLSARTLRRPNSLPKITVQLASEASSSPTIDDLHHQAGVQDEGDDREILGHRFACCCRPAANLREDVVRDAARPESSEVDAADPDRAFGQQAAGPPRLLRHGHARQADMGDLHRRPRARRRGAPARGSAAAVSVTTKPRPARGAQHLLLEAEAAQPFGAGALEELEVVGIEDDAGGVGVFPVDAHRPAERRGVVGRAGVARCRHRPAARPTRISSARPCDTPGPRPDGRPRRGRARRTGRPGARRGTRPRRGRGGRRRSG